VRYLFGILSGLLVGIIYNSSSLIQKYAVSKTDPTKPLFRQLLSHPLWILSILGSGLFAFLFTLLGQMMIGPTLLPGLAALGIIIIPIGAQKFLHEKNGRREYLGIIVIIIGVILLSFSKLSINTEEISWLEKSFFIKTIRYIGSLTSISLLLLVLGLFLKRRPQLTTVLFSLSAGVALAMGNILTAPISHQVTLLTQHSAQDVSFIYLLVIGLYILAVNVYAVVIMQYAYTVSHVSMLMPIQQTPIQIIPIISHFWFFSATFPSTYSKVAVPISVFLILLGAMALGNKDNG
jgi:drug/metabolite transporter (DMT)-like permease